MLRDQISRDIQKALLQLPVARDQSPVVEVVRTSDAKFGDYSSNVALRLNQLLVARDQRPVTGDKRQEKSKQAAMEAAKILADSLKDLPYIKKLEVKEPGFLNFFVKDSYWQEQVKEILDKSNQYGSNNIGKGKKARVEFVSANPTGPLHFGNARGGPIGDVLASVLAFSGYSVLREYLDNDRGNQVLELGKTLAAKAGFIEAKEEELTYKGEYTKELAEQIREDLDTKDLSEAEIIRRAGEIGVGIVFDEIIHDCAEMGIKFDNIVHESQLQEQAPETLAEFEKKGLIKKHEGALWFSPRNEFLEDRDAVVVKSDGSYTYFASDIVYHKEKFESGYDLVVDIFGSNTSGHVPKLQALAVVLGFDTAKLKIILYQFVRIKRGEEVVKMSKRAGNFVTAREVLAEVGRDALRFFILMYDPNSHIDFDLNLAKEKSSKNPVFYVQYANARIASILAKAPTDVILGRSETTTPESDSGQARMTGADYSLLTTDYELALIKQMTRLPELVEDITQSFAVHRLTAYAIDLADVFHKFYENCPVISDNIKQTESRLALISAAKIVFENTFSLLGISAPEKM